MKKQRISYKKIVKNELRDFVYINTAKPIAEQIFATAHEFGHICEVADKVWKILGYEGKPTEEEEEALELVAIFIKDSNTYLGNGTCVKTVSGIRTLIEYAESKENVDNYLLMKIKKEFDIADMPIAEEGFEIHIGENSDE